MMSIFEYAYKGHHREFRSRLKEITERSEKKSPASLMDFYSSLLKYGCGYGDYINYRFYDKTPDEKKEYVTTLTLNSFYKKISPKKYKPFFWGKSNFLKNFSSFTDRDFITAGCTEVQLEDFLKRHESFFVKPEFGFSGTGIEKRRSKEIVSINELWCKMRDERLLLEQPLVQHEKMSALCPGSVGTVRILTLGYNNQSRILFAAAHIGNGTSPVDSLSRGGLCCLADIQSGKLVGNAIDRNLNEAERHPVTGIRFDAFALPNWKQACRLALDGALVNQNTHVVGWDIALTPEGATFVSGSCTPRFDSIQLASRRGRKDILRNALAGLQDAPLPVDDPVDAAKEEELAALNAAEQSMGPLPERDATIQFYDEEMINPSPDPAADPEQETNGQESSSHCQSKDTIQ